MLSEVLVEAQKMTSLRRRCGLFPAGFPPPFGAHVDCVSVCMAFDQQADALCYALGDMSRAKAQQKTTKHVTYTTHFVPPGAPAMLGTKARHSL